MRRRRLAALAWFLPVWISGGIAAAAPAPAPVLASPLAPPISGIVSHLKDPIAGALVIFYNLGDASLARSRTASDGTFVMASAPVGVYDLVAYKKGFVPALVRVWHQPVSDGVSSVRIQLAAGSDGKGRNAAASSIWDLRDRLPADVLREITLEVGSQDAVASGRTRLDKTIAGEVRTVADVAQGDSSLSRTALGVRGGLPNGWSYDLRGDYSAVSDPSGISDTSATTGNATGIALDVATSPLDRVTLETRRHTLNLHDDRVASLQTHGVAWSRDGDEGSVQSVGARYVEEVNLYRVTSPGSNFFPLASRTWEVKANYARPAGDSPGVDVAMTYRHREGTVGPSGVGSDGAFLMSAPDGDLSAGSAVRLSSRAEVEGGVVTRYLAGGYGVAPRLGVRYDLGSNVQIFVRGLYRVVDSGTGSGTVLPLVTSVEAGGEATSRRAVVVGLERRAGADGSFRLEASDQQVNEAIRSFFDGDFLTDFDSLYLFEGNTVRQYKLTGTHRLTDTVSGSVALRYGTIGGNPAPESVSSYGIVDNHGRYWSARAAVEILPTRTGVAVLVRGVRQSLVTMATPRSNDSNKVAVSLAQDLSVVGVSPFGAVCKLLVALESARSAALTGDEGPYTSRLLGGVAISF
jgi:hypothetical protein